jgi:hypothetical protein
MLAILFFCAILKIKKEERKGKKMKINKCTTLAEACKLNKEEEREMNYKEMEIRNGAVTTDNGIKVYLTQQAEITGTIDDTYYTAYGVDKNGNEYVVEWNTTEEWDNLPDEAQEDQSNACDWDNPRSIERV